jgi:IS4 transposase
MRRVRALVEVDGKEREMEFLTNNMDWSPQSVADLYRSRWTIEVFFKQIKQTLKLADFLGHSANAVRWQIWTALLCYLLLRYQAFLSSWESSFTRLFTLIRAALWQKIDLLALLRSCGTGGGSFRALARPEQAYFPSFG